MVVLGPTAVFCDTKLRSNSPYSCRNAVISDPARIKTRFSKNKRSGALSPILDVGLMFRHSANSLKNEKKQKDKESIKIEVDCDWGIYLTCSRILYIHILIPADIIHMSENRESWILIIQGKYIRELFECWSRGRKRLQGCVLGHSEIFVRRKDIYWDFMRKLQILRR